MSGRSLFVPAAAATRFRRGSAAGRRRSGRRLTASGFGGALSYSASDLPDGLSLNANTGLISGPGAAPG